MLIVNVAFTKENHAKNIPTGQICNPKKEAKHVHRHCRRCLVMTLCLTSAANIINFCVDLDTRSFSVVINNVNYGVVLTFPTPFPHPLTPYFTLCRDEAFVLLDH